MNKADWTWMGHAAHFIGGHWTWMGHAAHFIGGQRCSFHLATEVGGYIVSTVGEYTPPGEDDWEPLVGRGPNEAPTYYETFVVRSVPAVGCCVFVWDDDDVLEINRYEDAIAAREGHMTLCEKWSLMEREEAPAT